MSDDDLVWALEVVVDLTIEITDEQVHEMVHILEHGAAGIEIGIDRLITRFSMGSDQMVEAVRDGVEEVRLALWEVGYEGDFMIRKVAVQDYFYLLEELASS